MINQLEKVVLKTKQYVLGQHFRTLWFSSHADVDFVKQPNKTPRSFTKD
jgi:hypothetical protein